MDMIIYTREDPTPDLESFVPVLVADIVILSRLYRKYKKPQRRIRAFKLSADRTLVVRTDGYNYHLRYVPLLYGGIGTATDDGMFKEYFPDVDLETLPEYMTYQEVFALATSIGHEKMVNYLLYEFTEYDAIWQAIKAAGHGGTVVLPNVNRRTHYPLYRKLNQLLGDEISLTNVDGALVIYRY